MINRLFKNISYPKESYGSFGEKISLEDCIVTTPNPDVKFKPLKLEICEEVKYKKHCKWIDEIYESGICLATDFEGEPYIEPERYILFPNGMMIGPFVALQHLYEYFKGGHHHTDYQKMLKMNSDVQDKETTEGSKRDRRDQLIELGLKVGKSIMVSYPDSLNLSLPSIKTSLQIKRKNMYDLTQICHEKWEDSKRLFSKFSEHLSCIENTGKFSTEFTHHRLWQFKVAPHIDKTTEEMINWCNTRYPAEISHQDSMIDTTIELCGIWQCLRNAIKRMRQVNKRKRSIKMNHAVKTTDPVTNECRKKANMKWFAELKEEAHERHGDEINIQKVYDNLEHKIFESLNLMFSYGDPGHFGEPDCDHDFSCEEKDGTVLRYLEFLIDCKESLLDMQEPEERDYFQSNAADYYLQLHNEKYEELLKNLDCLRGKFKGIKSCVPKDYPDWIDEWEMCLDVDVEKRNEHLLSVKGNRNVYEMILTFICTLYVIGHLIGRCDELIIAESLEGEKRKKLWPNLPISH